MKKLIFTLGATALFGLAAKAQFTNGGSYLYTTKNVGIGTNNPNSSFKLDVDGSLNLNKEGNQSTALLVRGDQALWYNGSYFSWGYRGDHNYFRRNIAIGRNTPNATLQVHNYDGGSGSSSLSQYAIAGTADGNDQATIGAEHDADGYANLNLGSKEGSSRMFWHISKRKIGNSHRLGYYFYDGTGSGFGQELFTFTRDGKLGVGSSSPSEKLEVYGGDFSIKGDDNNGGTIYFKNNSSQQIAHITGSSTGLFLGAGNTPGLSMNTDGDVTFYNHMNWMASRNFKLISFDGYGEYSMDFENGNRDSRWSVWDPVNKHILVVRNNGRVGIGTIDPEAELAVNGRVLAKEIECNSDASLWPDYVFEETYELKSLEEVEEYIKENKHLPGVPSAQETGENGVNMVEMDATLLEKIEELTLYMIQLQKENETLKGENEELKEGVSTVMRELELIKADISKK